MYGVRYPGIARKKPGTSLLGSSSDSKYNVSGILEAIGPWS